MESNLKNKRVLITRSAGLIGSKSSKFFVKKDNEGIGIELCF